MPEFETETEVQRYFPMVTLGKSDIALAEYQAASARCQADERAITIANGLLIGGLAAIFPVAAPLLKELFDNGALKQGAEFVFVAFFVSWAFVTSVVCSYVCELRRAYVFAARKVIVIRRLLGQSYGKFTLVLPSWRLEGADNPLALRLFPGWRLIEGYSVYATVFLLAVVIWIAALSAVPNISLFSGDPRVTATFIAAIWSVYWLWSVRRKLYDTHENDTLAFAKIIARILSIDVVGNFHYTLYRAQLSSSEGHRLKLNFGTIKPIVIFREDRGFLSHNGFSLRSTARAMRDWAFRTPSGGASTITQQLARSLFIVNSRSRFRRKLVEILLAFWLEKILSKTEIIEIYITSVRYDRNVYGYIAARNHFFGLAESETNKAEALVIVERVANILGNFRASSVQKMIEDAISQNIISTKDAFDALKLYEDLIKDEIIKADKARSPSDIATALGLLP